MTDTKQTAGAQIRQELKKQLGATSRQISVREDYNSVNVTIKAEGFNLKAVEKIARQHESIDRCKYSGEILSGGNTYIFVSFAWELEKQVSERIISETQTIFTTMQTVKVNNGERFTVDGVKFLLMNEGSSFEIYALEDDGSIDYNINRHYAGNDSAKTLASYIAQFMLGQQ